MQEKILVCEQCDQPIRETDEFCPHCGGLFVEGVKCDRHSARNAAGVCVLCLLPWCSECSETVNGHVLCRKHASYEIVEEMARICGVNNSATAEYFRACLEEGGFHPFVYAAMGKHRGSLADAAVSTNTGGRVLVDSGGEFKIMVPFQEVEPAEGFLEELDTARCRIK